MRVLVVLLSIAVAACDPAAALPVVRTKAVPVLYPAPAEGAADGHVHEYY